MAVATLFAVLTGFERAIFQRGYFAESWLPVRFASTVDSAPVMLDGIRSAAGDPANPWLRCYLADLRRCGGRSPGRKAGASSSSTVTSLFLERVGVRFELNADPEIQVRREPACRAHRQRADRRDF